MAFIPPKPIIDWFDERLGYWGKPVTYKGGDELQAVVNKFIDVCGLSKVNSTKIALRSLLLNLYFIDL